MAGRALRSAIRASGDRESGIGRTPRPTGAPDRVLRYPREMRSGGSPFSRSTQSRFTSALTCLAASCSLLAPVALAQDTAAEPDRSDAIDEAELIERARALHERVLTLDTHKDIPDLLASENVPDDPERARVFRERFDPTVRGTQQVDFVKSREGHYDVAFYIVYVGQGDLTPPAFRRALDRANLKFEAIERMCRRFPDEIGFARTPDDVWRLHREGKLVCTIGIENGYPMGEDLSLIEQFHARGARYMGITHNGHNQLGDSHTPSEPMHGGLTELGRKAVAEMNRVGILVDISHSAKTTMLEAVELSAAPVIASHSGCRAVHDHTRNLDDEQLRAVADNGGVVQMVALDAFVKDQSARRQAQSELRRELGLGWGGEPAEDVTPAERDAMRRRFREGLVKIDERYPRADVRDFVDHIDHAVKVMGIDHVGISSDFDGGGGIDGWANASESFNVTLELVRRGYTEEQIGKIWSGNTLRIWAAAEAVAERLRGERRD
jgi:membrane dipeptidase